MSAAHKNECRGGARQVVKTISKYATDFIAATARYASANPEFCFMFVVLTVQCVAIALMATSNSPTRGHPKLVKLAQPLQGLPT